jgi:hypothetical protein
MSDISASALGEHVDAEFEKAVANCSTAAEISELMKNRAVTVGLVTRDRFSPDVLIPTEPGTQPRRYARSLIVNGEKVIIEGESENDLNANEAAFYRRTFNGTEPAKTTEQTQQTEQPRNERGQFVAAEPVITEEQRKTLELDFQLGRISAAEYIERSGAVSDYLDKNGIPLETLRETVAEKRNAVAVSSWQDATTEFLSSPAGSDWPGGAKNLEIAGNILAENNLLDQPSAETLGRVWAHMKENGLAVENPELISRQRIASANSSEEIRAALGQTSSSLFRR